VEVNIVGECTNTTRSFGVSSHSAGGQLEANLRKKKKGERMGARQRGRGHDDQTRRAILLPFICHYLPSFAHLPPHHQHLL